MSRGGAPVAPPDVVSDVSGPGPYAGPVDGTSEPGPRAGAVDGTSGHPVRTPVPRATSGGAPGAQEAGIAPHRADPGAHEAASRGGVGAVPVDALRSGDGLAVLRGILAGELPRPPITETLGFTLAEVGPGLAVFTATPGEHLYNPMGAVHGGFAMTLLDSAMTCAVLTALAAGEGCTTMETKVNFVRPLLASTGPVRAEGRLLHAGTRVATAEGRLVDAAGRLHAHGTTTCLRFPL